MTSKLLQLPKTIAELARTIKQHVGSNGTAHLPVSTDADGFMTSSELKEHNQIFKQRTRLDNVDILTLSPGLYVGTGYLNHPLQPTIKTTWVSNIDVTFGYGGRVMIELTDSSSGYRWFRTINTPGDLTSGSSGWLQEGFDYSILWKGSSYIDSPITLDQPIVDPNGYDKYSEFIIDYNTDTGNYDFVKGNKYGARIDTFNSADTDNVKTINFYEMLISFKNDSSNTKTTVTGDINRSDSIYPQSTSDSTLHIQNSDKKMMITKIRGIR